MVWFEFLSNVKKLDENDRNFEKKEINYECGKFY